MHEEYKLSMTEELDNILSSINKKLEMAAIRRDTLSRDDSDDAKAEIDEIDENVRSLRKSAKHMIELLSLLSKREALVVLLPEEDQLTLETLNYKIEPCLPDGLPTVVPKIGGKHTLSYALSRVKRPPNNPLEEAQSQLMNAIINLSGYVEESGRLDRLANSAPDQSLPTNKFLIEAVMRINAQILLLNSQDDMSNRLSEIEDAIANLRDIAEAKGIVDTTGPGAHRLTAKQSEMVEMWSAYNQSYAAYLEESAVRNEEKKDEKE